MTDRQDPLVKDQPLGGEDMTPLAQYGGETPPTPAWFTKAVATPYTTHRVEVAGAEIEYQRWSSSDKPGLLLVHGNGAHGHWWDFIAPYFASQYNVVAMTFAGMGDSGRRDAYDMATFSAEQIAVIEDSGMFEHDIKPIICAHSFGGFVTLLTGADHGHRLTGTIIVDSPVNPPDRPHSGPPSRPKGNRVYPSLAEALARFRLAPPQPCDNHYAMDYIARHSLKEGIGDRGETGFTWKFDPGIWRHFEAGRAPSDLLKATACRIAIMRGEDSYLVPDEVRDYMVECLGHAAPFISIPHAHHHVMLDQPLAFIAALRTLLGEWDHSAPNRSV